MGIIGLLPIFQDNRRAQPAFEVEQRRVAEVVLDEARLDVGDDAVQAVLLEVDLIDLFLQPADFRCVLAKLRLQRRTLGLDLLVRKQFYDSLLNDYFDRARTIVVATHQVEEIQDVLTDLMFIDRGRIVLQLTMEEVEARYLEVMVRPDAVGEARSLGPIHERQVFGRSILLFDRADRNRLAALGDVRTPRVADLFVAVIGRNAETQGAAR